MLTFYSSDMVSSEAKWAVENCELTTRFLQLATYKSYIGTYSVLVPSLLAVVILLLFSAFFSSSESAIFSLPDEWVQTTSKVDTRDSRTLYQLRANPHRLFVTLLVGNTLVNNAITSIITLLVCAVLGVPGAILVILLAVFDIAFTAAVVPALLV